MAEIIDEELLKKLNKFTRRELNADEVYCFSVILCDNEVDRDNERFSIDSLNTLAKLFIGKTGIFDHNPKGSNQTARIFDTEIVTVMERQTSTDEPYTYIKAMAYMVKTATNDDLIKEIDGGIKKEVSVSCSVEKQVCSICGANTREKACSHKKGKLYNGVKCHVVLENPTDAYEWSFVAIPAQINAGVTKQKQKHFGGEYSINQDEVVIKASELSELREKALLQDEALEAVRDELKREVVKLSFLCHPETAVKTLLRIAEGMTLGELLEMKKELAYTAKGLEKSQIFKAENVTNTNNQQFKV